jgi:hypothetical protein
MIVRNIPFSVFEFALAACTPSAFPLFVSRFLLEFEGGFDGALLEVEGKESRFIRIIFPFEVFAHDALIDILGCYNSSTMEGSLLLRSKVSNCEPKKVHSYTSPRVEEYERMASRYQQYVGQLAPKIDSICEKENYRTYLKEQKLHSIRHHLNAKKTQLESNLR